MTRTEFLDYYHVPLNHSEPDTVFPEDELDFKQLHTLIHTLLLRNTLIQTSDVYDGFVVKILNRGDVVCDVAFHSGTYGHEDGLLEFWTEYGDPQGWLTAEEAFKCILHAFETYGCLGHLHTSRPLKDAVADAKKKMKEVLKAY